MSKAFTVVIPARYASSRLPGKPLLNIAGRSMICHVWERASQSNANQVVVATDHPAIVVACEEVGARVLMTREDHPTGTDRLTEVADILGLVDDDIMVNVQGDEPLLPPALINQVAANLAAHPEAGVGTLAEPITDAQTLFDPNVVKVITDENGLALTFSRAPIPWARDLFAQSRDQLPPGVDYRRHIGLYAYRVGLLRQFQHWPPCALETCESLEQLRVMWHGVRIHVADAVEPPGLGVDTAEDLERVRQLLEG